MEKEQHSEGLTKMEKEKQKWKNDNMEKQWMEHSLFSVTIVCIDKHLDDASTHDDHMLSAAPRRRLNESSLTRVHCVQKRSKIIKRNKKHKKQKK